MAFITMQPSTGHVHAHYGSSLIMFVIDSYISINKHMCSLF